MSQPDDEFDRSEIDDSLGPGLRSTPRRPWLGPHRPLLQRVASHVVEFLHVEAAGGIMLVVAAVVAIGWANSPWAGSYEDIWSAQIALSWGGFGLGEDLRHWINDGLMVLFFFVVGVEIKDEFVNGDLAEPRRAALPVAAAAGGMILPALL